MHATRVDISSTLHSEDWMCKKKKKYRNAILNFAGMLRKSVHRQKVSCHCIYYHGMCYFMENHRSVIGIPS